jgi:hypothetical protein
LLSEHHIRKGVIVRYDPLPSCRSLFSTCDKCLESNFDCQWCGNRCQEKFLTCPIPNLNLCTDTSRLSSSSGYFESRHAAAIFGLLLLIFGMGCGGSLFYGYLRPESKPGRLLSRLRLARYKRFWERGSFSETDSTLRRDSQVTVASSITTL